MLVASTNFLIPNWTFVAELIIFLIVMGVLAKFILPPLQKAVETRASSIRGELQRADAARADGEQAVRQRREVLAEARSEARSIIDEATKAADEERAAARTRAQEEYARLLDEAQASIEAERASAQLELVADMAPLVVAAAERVIRSQVDPHRHAALIDAAVAAARSLPTSVGQDVSGEGAER
jgi:F-type H+-transporting ATPase subunit b